MKGLALILFCLAASSAVFSQNLLFNGGFEQVNICTEYSQPCSPAGWRTSSDIVMGYHAMPQKAHSGLYALPLLMYEANDTGFCTYWQTAMLCSLQKDSLYRLHFFVRCSPSHPPFLSLGIGFPQNWLYYPGSRKYFSNLLAVQLVRIISPGKNGEWAEAELIYRAQGGESFMIMGNFLSVSEMEAEGASLTRTIRYWIDDISLEPVQGNVGESGKNSELVKAALLADHNRHSRPRVLLPYTADARHELKAGLQADSFNTQPLFFAFDSDKTDAVTELQLDRLIKYIQTTPVDSIIIKGYADDLGSQSYNVDLSGRRAASVAAFLIKHHIPASSIKLHAIGEEGSCDSTARYYNRRVDIIIYSTVHPD